MKELASVKKDISQQEKNAENICLWTAANDRKMIKPPIFINEVSWHEMNYNDELTLRIENPFLRKIEKKLRQEIYMWKHMPGNMVVNGYMECPIIVKGDNFGIEEEADIAFSDTENDVVSRHFHIQIQNEDDINKIKEPKVSVDWETTNKNLEMMEEIFADTLEVKLVGKQGYWFTPWDNLIRLTGVEPVMIDMIENPEYIRKLVTRYVDVSIELLEQYQKLGIWDSNNSNIRVGSGGYGYTTDLKRPEEYRKNAGIPTDQIWGCGNAQIFSSVSPEMHWEFSLEQEIRWLEHFGLNYYGCCEPLHNKMDILERIPNLRKISVSPWCDVKKISEQAEGKYVLSCKPNPAVFAAVSFDEDYARHDIRKILTESEGCNIELIMKDISTVSYEPQRLWRWHEIAVEEINRFYN